MSDTVRGLPGVRTTVPGADRHRARLVRGLVLVATSFAVGCTYGPEERTATVRQVTRLGDHARAVVVVQRDAFRRPTGLSAFPDGGKWKYSERSSAEYLIDARSHEVRLLAEQSAPDDLRESFTAWVVGIEGDSVTYVRLTGCPKGGECHPRLQRSAVFRLSIQGSLQAVDSIPPDAGLPGWMAARRPGEDDYVRFGAEADAVTVRFEENGVAERRFRVSSDGTLVAAGG